MCVCVGSFGTGGVQIWQVIVGYYRTESKGFWGGWLRTKWPCQRMSRRGGRGGGAGGAGRSGGEMLG